MILSTKKMTFDKKIRNQRSAKIQIPDREIEKKTMDHNFLGTMFQTPIFGSKIKLLPI